jgi:hypothetical protein
MAVNGAVAFGLGISEIIGCGDHLIPCSFDFYAIGLRGLRKYIEDEEGL